MFGTRKVRCPDGRVLRVFRSPEKAFPIALSNSRTSTKAAVDGLEGVKGEAGREHQTEIEAILIRLTESNSSLMAEHHAAYIAFSADPCFKPGYLHERFEALQQDRLSLDAAALRARLLENLVRSGATGEEINAGIRSVLTALESSTGMQVATQILNAKAEVDRWERRL